MFFFSYGFATNKCENNNTLSSVFSCARRRASHIKTNASRFWLFHRQAWREAVSTDSTRLNRQMKISLVTTSGVSFCRRRIDERNFTPGSFGIHTFRFTVITCCLGPPADTGAFLCGRERIGSNFQGIAHEEKGKRAWKSFDWNQKLLSRKFCTRGATLSRLGGLPVILLLPPDH